MQCFQILYSAFKHCTVLSNIVQCFQALHDGNAMHRPICIAAHQLQSIVKAYFGMSGVVLLVIGVEQCKRMVVYGEQSLGPKVWQR